MDPPHESVEAVADAAEQPIMHNEPSQDDSLDTVLSSPKSPRQLAVQAIRRAASVREGSSTSPRGVARMGLERSASDAARRLAMAKLTGETIVAPPEYMVPKTPLPTGPLPSLADLQARAELRLAMGSPEQGGLSRNGSLASHGMLSRNNSTASHAMLSRSPSAASTGLSRNASMARARGMVSPSHSSGDVSIEEEGPQDADEAQKKTDERQEARSNLIRKLSRGRLAAGAAAEARERAAAAKEGASPAAPGLQRRPSLAEVLAKAQVRSKQPVGTDETAEHLPTQNAQAEALSNPLSTSSDQFQPPGTASSIASALRSATSPSHTSSRSVEASTPARFDVASPASMLSSAISSKGMYDHIPIPPVPDTPDSVASPPGLKHVSPSQESIFSAISNFRPYRHTVERDRDMAEAEMRMEDNFEFELGAAAGATEEHSFVPTVGDLEADGPAQDLSGPKATPDVDAQSHDPPDSPLDAKMLCPAGLQNDNYSNGVVSASFSASETVSPEVRPIDSMPETPEMASPVSPFAYSSAPPLPSVHRATDQGQQSRVDMRASPTDLIKPDRRRHESTVSTDSFPVSVSASHSSRHPYSMTMALDGHPPLPVNNEDAQDRPPMPTRSDLLAARGSGTAHTARESSGTDATASSLHASVGPSPEHSAPATAAAEYRFPTPLAGHRDLPQRPTSLSSTDGLDRKMDRMIDHLEALQAADQRPAPSVLTSAHAVLPKQPASQSMQAQNSATALHEFHATHHPAHHVPHEIKPKASHAVPPAIVSSTLPIPPATGADYAKYADSKLAPFPGLAELERQRASPAASGRPVQPKNAGLARPSGHTYDSSRDLVAQDRDRYQSDGSGQNDSAPSLARTGTGSSTSSTSAEALFPPVVSASGVTKDQVMKRLNDMLAMHPAPKQPTALDIPPRHLLLHAPVLQVVNANTVKDRYLLLFNDILVIAKPLVEDNARGEPVTPTLDTRFAVKSIVELPKLKLTAQAAEVGEDPVQKRKHPLLLTFVDRFANDPKKAISALIAKAGLPNDPATIANLLFRNPELNRSQLGSYLSMKEQKPVLKAYCDRFRLAGLRIEDALRVFIASLRLPNDYSAAEYLLGVFSSQWLLNNPGTGMTNDSVFATKLVISIMELNDALHSGIDDETAAAGNLFSFPNHAITVDDFIAAFRMKDPHGALPDEHLTRIYLSIRKDRVQQAADNSIASVTPEIEVLTHPSRLPSRLTYRTPSENISVTLPKVDPKFSIRLVGQDLRFEPPLLTFARSRTATFRVTPTALGSKSMLFIKLGTTANFYRNLPVNKTFSVERAFMSHTFQIAFVNHLGVKRKYLFSMGTAEAKFTWVDTLRQRIENSPIEQEGTPRATKVAHAVSLQVLRDALIAPDEPPPVLANKPSIIPGRPGFVTPPGSRGGLKSAAGALQRSNSFSKTYPHGLGKAEADLNTERRPSGGQIVIGQGLTPMARRGSKDDTSSNKKGSEVVTMVQQNSFLPLVLGLVSAGAGVDAMPRPALAPNPLPVQATPPQIGRGTGRFNNL